jgi:malate dehydrogenase
VVSDGSYDIPKGLLAGFPVLSRNGSYEIVRGLEIDEFGRKRIDHSVAELLEERDMVIKAWLVRAGRVRAADHIAVTRPR